MHQHQLVIGPEHQQHQPVIGPEHQQHQRANIISRLLSEHRQFQPTPGPSIISISQASFEHHQHLSRSSVGSIMRAQASSAGPRLSIIGFSRPLSEHPQRPQPQASSASAGYPARTSVASAGPRLSIISISRLSGPSINSISRASFQHHQHHRASPGLRLGIISISRPTGPSIISISAKTSSAGSLPSILSLRPQAKHHQH